MESSRPNLESELSFLKKNSSLTDDLLLDLFCQYESRFGEKFNTSKDKSHQVLNFHGGPSKQEIYRENIKNGNLVSSEIGPILQRAIPSFAGGLYRKKHKKQKREVQMVEKPAKTLEAPNLADNFYYNIATFKSKSRELLVALDSDLHLFNFENNHTENLKSLEGDESITSVSGHHDIPVVCLASENGNISIIDAVKGVTIREILFANTDLDSDNFMELEGTR